MFQANIFHPIERKRFPICRITWIVLLAICISLLLFNFTNEEIGSNPILKTLIISLTLLSIPVLFLTSYCRYRRYYKSQLNGKLLDELSISEIGINVQDQIFKLDEILEMGVVINSHRTVYLHGVDNQLIIRSRAENKSISFELQSKTEYKKLIETLIVLRQHGVNINLIDNLAKKTKVK